MPSTRPRRGSIRPRATLRKALAADALPAPTRPEVALTAARADLAATDAALERTRIRAASPGTALQVNAKAGETATPSPEQVLVVVGDLLVAARQGGDRGARHRQAARRPGRDHSLRCVSRQGFRRQDRHPGPGPGAEPHRPARSAQAYRCRYARDHDRSRRPAAAAARHARRRLLQARRDGQRPAGELAGRCRRRGLPAHAGDPPVSRGSAELRLRPLRLRGY